MSLRVWLPLNGSLENKGLDDITVTNNGATIDNNGKIGKCYSFVNGYLNLPSSLMSNFKECSVCFWININSWNTSYETYFHAGKNSYSWTDYIFGILRNAANSTVCFTIGNGSTASNSNYLTSAWSVGEWMHVAFIYSIGKCKIYLNGNIDKEYDTSIVPDFTKITGITIGRSNGSAYQTNCKMNDFRIYDHALSPLEVKQISQGLILHYPLNNVIGGLPRLWSLASYTRSIDLTTSYAYIYSIPNNTVWLTPGKQYTVAAEVKVNQNNILFYFDSNCTDANGVYSGNDAAQTVQYNPVVNLEKDKWVPVYITTTIKNDAGKPYYHHAFLFRTNSGTLTTNCEIRNIEVYEGNLKLRRGLLPIDIIEYDTSGYCNNGMRIGTFSWTSDTPKYNVSTHIGSTSSKIHISDFPTSGFGNSYSFAWWGKRSSNTPMFWGFSNGNRLNGMYYGYLWNTGDGTSNPIYKPNTTTQIIAPSLNTWHHYVMTGDGTTCKLYLDGELYGQAKTYKSITGTSIYINGWDSGTAYCHDNMDMSDFRIYATALSAEDVKDLYELGATIDTNGVLSTYEFTEQ